MNGLGNDYIFIDRTIQQVCLTEDDVKRLSDRHFGIGGDGVVLIDNSRVADAKMTIYNADGSRAEMCGNALRCVGRYVHDHFAQDKLHLLIDTDAGTKSLDLDLSQGCVNKVTANIGSGKITGKCAVKCGDGVHEFFTVDVGNPHAITFDEDFDIDVFGEYVSTHPLFPTRTNVEKATVLSPNSLKVSVYERGSGRTLACGTGAGASAYLAMTLCAVKNDVDVTLDGGVLNVKQINNSLFITGDAKYNFYGEIDYYGKT